MPTDTFNITANAQDGSGSLSGGTYPGGVTSFSANDGSGTIYANRGTNGATFFVDNALMYFDTSSLPDNASVSAAELEVFVLDLQDADNLSIVGEYYAYDGSPTVAGDITLDDTATAFSAVDISAIGDDAPEIFTLENLSNINVSGNTGFRLKATKRAADAAPTGFNYIGIVEFEHATLQAPILRVTYSVPTRLDWSKYPRPVLRQV